jgi:hypothetical protein
MNTNEMTLNQIKEKGFIALKKELGVVGFIRFLNMFSTGSGNYVEDRKELLNSYDVDSIIREIDDSKKPGA